MALDDGFNLIWSLKLQTGEGPASQPQGAQPPEAPKPAPAAPGSALAALKKRYEERAQAEKPAPPAWRRWIRPAGYLAVLGMIVWAVRSYTLYTFPADGTNMVPLYAPGARVLVHVGFRTPEKLHRGDCVLIEIQVQGRAVRMVSRIVALPGERASVTDGKLSINGKPFIEEYLATAIVEKPRGSREEVTVPEDGLYVLNDARNSPVMDSRDFGPVRGGQVIGKVIATVGGGE